MPAEAMAYQQPTPLAGTVHYRREYRDILGRPMTGAVGITGTARSVNGEAVAIPAPVTVDLVGGVLEVDLPPDTYQLNANLRTADSLRATDVDTITLEAS